jgi:hypothetical protein
VLCRIAWRTDNRQGRRQIDQIGEKFWNRLYEQQEEQGKARLAPCRHAAEEQNYPACVKVQQKDGPITSARPPIATAPRSPLQPGTMSIPNWSSKTEMPQQA